MASALYTFEFLQRFNQFHVFSNWLITVSTWVDDFVKALRAWLTARAGILYYKLASVYHI